MVTTESKKEFIKWFQNNYTFKRRECTWMFNHFISNEDVLSRMKFVFNTKSYPNVIIMSTICSDKEPLLYCNQMVKSTDAEKMFHKIRISKDEVFHIQLNFKDNGTCTRYLSILEDEVMEKEIASKIDIFMDKMLLKGKIELLKKQIDKALDDRDEKEFYKLTNDLNKLI